jgi:ubiquinone biosynthesis protein
VSAVVRFTWVDAASRRRERGVFKVLKPHIPACFAEDVDILRGIAGLFAGGAAVRDTLDDVCELLAREIDFPHEQDTLEKAADTYRGVPGVRVPRLIRSLSSSVVTAMTEEHGVKVVDAFAGQPARRREVAQEIVEAAIAAPLFMSAGESLFHADPHAGNLLYDEDARELVLLDWALSGTLTGEQVRQMTVFLLMLALRDAPGATAAIVALSEGGRETDIRERVVRFIRGSPWFRIPGSREAMQLLDGLALDGVRFPAALLMLRKVFFTLDGILHELAGPELSVDAVVLRWLARNWNSVRLPLAPADWLTLQCSSLFYGTRTWLDLFSSAQPQ